MAIIVNGHRIIISKDIFIIHHGRRMGPYDEKEVRNLQLSGHVDLTDPAWREGLDDWVPLANLLVRGSVMERGPVPPPQPDPSSWVHTLAVKDAASRLAHLNGHSQEKKRFDVQQEDEFDDDPSLEILSRAWNQGLFLTKLLLQTLLILILWEATFLTIHHFLQIGFFGWTVTGMTSTLYVWLPLALLASSQMFFFARFFVNFVPCASAAFCLAVDFAVFVYRNNFSALWVSGINWSHDPHRQFFLGMVCGLLSLILLALAACLGRDYRLCGGRWPGLS